MEKKVTLILKCRTKSVLAFIKKLYLKPSIAIFFVLLSCGNTTTKPKQKNVVNEVIGWNLPIEKIPDLAEKYNLEAKAAIQLKDLKSAASLLYLALEQAPSMDNVRFELAMVLVALNKPEDALKQFDHLLLSDLPGYLWKISGDPVLRLHTENQFFSRLQLIIESRTKLWEKQIKQGWPTVYVWQSPEVLSIEPPEFYPAYRMRAGIFYPDTQRFLPIGLPNNQVFSLLINTDEQQLLNIQADATFDLFSHLHNISWQIQPWLLTDVNTSIINKPIEEDSVFYAADFWFRDKELVMNGVEEADNFNTSPPANNNQHILRLLGEGSLIASTETQARMLENNVLLLNEKPIQLGNGHTESQQQSTLILGNNVFIVSNHYGCNYDDMQNPPLPYQRHVIDKVNMKTGDVFRLSEGNVAASIQVFEEKHLALQRGEQLDVLFLGEPSNIKMLPKGLMLHAPLRKKNCIYN